MWKEVIPQHLKKFHRRLRLSEWKGTEFMEEEVAAEAAVTGPSD